MFEHRRHDDRTTARDHVDHARRKSASSIAFIAGTK
jgi:hypothetical protein